MAWINAETTFFKYPETSLQNEVQGEPTKKMSFENELRRLLENFTIFTI